MSKPAITIHDELDLQEVKDTYVNDKQDADLSELLFTGHVQWRNTVVTEDPPPKDHANLWKQWKQQLRACGVEPFEE